MGNKSAKNTNKPAADPLTCISDPEIKPTTMPPIMPVKTALAGLTPTATAIPIHKGNANRKTTMEEKNHPESVPNVTRHAHLAPHSVGASRYSSISSARKLEISRG
jgi:hypothetical protein